MKLVTLQQARDQLRSDTNADDNDLNMKIEAASQAVLDYLEDGADSFLDTAGELIQDTSGDPVGVPANVRMAVLVLVDILYNNRGNVEATNFNYLPDTVTYLLYPLRVPTAL